MGKKKALIMGINEYEDKGLWQLKYAISDAQEICDILKNKDIGEFDSDDVIFLGDKDTPTKSKVEERLETVLNKADVDDLVFIYFSGHGKLDKSGKLCLAVKNTRTDCLLATSVHLDNIQKMIDYSKCKRVVFMIDCCYSGAAGETIKGDVPARSFEQFASEQGKIIISASRGFGVARERDDIKHGVFTHYVLEGLKGKADNDKDGNISIGELYTYVRDNVEKETNGQQIPMMWGIDEKGEIILAKNVGKKEEIEAKIKKVYSYYDTKEISGSICEKVVEIIIKPYSALCDKEKKLYKYIEDLVNGEITPKFFIQSWNRAEKEVMDESLRLKQQERQPGATIETKEIKQVPGYTLKEDTRRETAHIEKNVLEDKRLSTEDLKSTAAVGQQQSGGAVRNLVFISYSHKDKEWFNKLLKKLKSLENKGLKIWTDEKIETGAKWRDEIEKALAATRIAVLLVSDDFLNSEFITKKELPKLLNSAEKGGLTQIFWIRVNKCFYETTQIETYQAAHDVSKPLNSLSESELDDVLYEICTKIKKASGLNDEGEL